jgi:peroxiredoxin Q/BCP
MSDLKGRLIVLYFYPKDDTAACTQEAIAFSKAGSDFEKAGAVVLGVSRDNIAAHKRFRDKYDLTIRLASDPDAALAQTYGVWGEKSLYGKKYMGVERATFLIDRSGRVSKVWRKVKVPGHVEAVLAAVSEL